MNAAQTRNFKRVKDTKHTTVYEEQPQPGTPPIVGTIYVQKWFAGEAQEVRVTVEPVTNAAAK